MSKEEKKQAIIDKSGHIMYLKGYNATGVQEIADAAGIPKGSFYNYFENKEQYAIDLMECYCQEGCDHMDSIFAMKELTPLARISLMFDTMIEHFTREEKFTKGSFIGNISQEMGDVSKPLSIAAEDNYKKMVEHLKTVLQEAREAGEIKESLDIDKVANVILNSKEGAMVRMKASKDSAPLWIFKDMIMELLTK
ncbi:MAG: TetR family transcriptional regulator C-terminal domain-containing protein [Bacteroidetes bacterium]|nr:TetR family transcriptional regulator C-terminal domain-containing protein [Bacteroidota bacterium]